MQTGQKQTEDTPVNILVSKFLKIPDDMEMMIMHCWGQFFEGILYISRQRAAQIHFKIWFNWPIFL